MRQNDLEKLNNALAQNSDRTEAALALFFDSKSCEGSLNTIREAQEYSLLGGGKRIRPFLVNEVCRMLGGSEEASMPFAVAIEMIHTYSLIHDDLPCMDDDDMRRGKLTSHKVFGEANAVLAGDALLTNAFLAAAGNKKVSPNVCVRAIELLSIAAGDAGMIGGQVIDIEGESRSLDFDELLRLHSLKTGKLIEVSAALGCLAAGYDESSDKYARCCAYARYIGLAFQAVDDLLDVTGDEAIVGKTLSSDAENSKTTFLSFYDVEGVKAYAAELTKKAIDEIECLDEGRILTTLAEYLLERKK